MRDERAHLQLFDLIARDWTLPSQARQITFNADSSAVAFACVDGTIQLAATVDKASASLRTRRAIDTGRLTIAPRDKPFLPLKSADFTEGRSSDVVPYGVAGFAFAKSTGRINTLTAGGIAVHMKVRAQAGITILATSPDGSNVAFSCGAQVCIADVAGTSLRYVPAASIVRAMAFSPDGAVLAVTYANGVSRWLLEAINDPPFEAAFVGTPTDLAWHEDGTWLAVGLAEEGFCLINTTENSVRLHGNFPSPVRSVKFGRSTNTITAPGAFRVAAWDLADGHAIATGKPGLVLVSAVATSPNRNLVAVGYANGLLSLAEIGRPSEILLREDTGVAIDTMAWSPDGNYLALSGADGTAALVEFPDAMFKSAAN